MEVVQLMNREKTSTRQVDGINLRRKSPEIYRITGKQVPPIIAVVKILGKYMKENSCVGQ